MPDPNKTKQENSGLYSFSYDPMEFGSMHDYTLAMTELKWLREVKGKLEKSDLDKVSIKYKFPNSFLKKGLEGINYPEDYIISKGGFYPIFYNWMMRDHSVSIKLLELFIDYLKKVRKRAYYMIFYTAYLPIILFIILNYYFKLPFNDTIIPVLLLIIPLLISELSHLNQEVSDKKYIYEDYKNQIKSTFDKELYSHEKFIKENLKNLMYAGDIMLNKIKNAPFIQGIKVGEEYKETKITLNKYQKLLIKLGILSKDIHEVKKEYIPAFYVENIIQEYITRINQIR